MHTITQLTQGTPEWHAHRAKHFNASEASAMLGISPYQTRTDLLKAKATGITPEVDGAKQRLFDAGHAAEAAARPEAERIIDQELYPITATLEVDGMHLSASYDGATIGEDIVWEHKLANVSLLESLSLGVIPEQYHPQLEQQLMIIGAEKALFMATSSDKTAMEHVWYTSNPELSQRILAGWKQFLIDLAEFKPDPVIAKVVAAPMESLPAVSVSLAGQLVVASNLPEFGTALRTFISRIPATPSTDQEFADCESACKALKRAEDALESSEEHALAQMSDVNELRRTIADLRNLARQTRLASEKAVAARKETIRGEIVAEGIAQASKHMQSLNDRLGRSLMPPVQADFGGVIKGKRSVDSIREAVSNELARVKIESNAIADRIQINLNTLNKAPDYAFLFADIAQLVLKASDDLAAVIQNRISAHEAKESARIEADRARIAEQERIKAEAAAKARADAEAAAARPAPQVQSASVAEERVERIVTAPDVVKSTVVAMPVRAPAPSTPPTLRLGQIGERLGFGLTAEFLKNLGFEPAATDKNSKLFHESDFPLICMRLVSHIQSVQTRAAA